MLQNRYEEVKWENVITEAIDKLPKDLSAEQILIRSSNIGAIRIAQKVGLENYKSFLNSFFIILKSFLKDK